MPCPLVFIYFFFMCIECSQKHLCLTFVFLNLQECDKKIAECRKSILNVKRSYDSECKNLGIIGKNVRQELLDLVTVLPRDFDDIGLKCKGLLSVIEFYAAFVEFSISR